MSETSYQGSCLCGAVRYQINGGIGDIMQCHCSICRKASGSAFAVNALVQSADFVLLSGKDALKSYSASAGAERWFCGACGSPIYSMRTNAPDVYRLRLGSLDTPLKRTPSCHIFTASKAEWDVIYDDLPQYAERP